MTWLEQFIANYEGKSSGARELQPYMKENYKGNAYIPWATMERLTYMQDPDAVFVTYTDTDGTPLFSRNMTLDITTKDQTTHSEFYTHFVRVGVTFLGKTIVEDYPVQDKAYDAPKVVDSNLVNKAIQRAKAKVASRVTGLALKLYESKDLQFDEPEVVAKPPVAKPVPPMIEPAPAPAPVVVDKNTPAPAPAPVAPTPAPVAPETNTVDGTYGQFIVNNWEKLASVFPTYNGTLQKKYGWQFVETMSVAEINQKMSALPNPQFIFDQMKKKAGL